MAALINDESKPGYGAVPLLQKPEKSSRLRQGAVLAAVFCAGMGAATFVKRNPFAASPLAFAVEDCDFGDACEACGMGLFESVDTETFCSTFDATCSADCSEGTIECIESELCESSDDSAGDDHLAHCEADDACKGCAMGLFESTDSETFCSTLDATCSDCSAENTECIKAGLCESGDDDDDDPLAQCGFTDACESCGKGLFESVEIETFCSTFETTCSSECASSTIGCVESVLCEYSGAKVAWK